MNKGKEDLLDATPILFLVCYVVCIMFGILGYIAGFANEWPPRFEFTLAKCTSVVIMAVFFIGGGIWYIFTCRWCKTIIRKSWIGVINWRGLLKAEKRIGKPPFLFEFHWGRGIKSGLVAGWFE